MAVAVVLLPIPFRWRLVDARCAAPVRDEMEKVGCLLLVVDDDDCHPDTD